MIHKYKIWRINLLEKKRDTLISEFKWAIDNLKGEEYDIYTDIIAVQMMAVDRKLSKLREKK